MIGPRGLVMLVRIKTIENVGLLDSKYFSLLGEELDWCLQGRKYGWQSWYVPEAKIWHKIARSTKKMSGLSHYYMTRNRIFFMRESLKNRIFWFFVGYFFRSRFFEKTRRECYSLKEMLNYSNVF